MLFLTTQLPYPPFSGGLIKSYRLVRSLSAHFELVVACPLKGDDAKHVLTFTREAGIKKLVSESFEVERTPMNWIKSISKGKTLNEFRGFSTSLIDKIHEEIQHHDCIIVDHYEMMQYVPETYCGKIILHTHNAEHVMWSRFADLEKNPVKRKVLRTESRRIQRAEKECCERADVVFAAPNDIEAFEAIGVDLGKLEQTFHLGNDEMLECDDIAFDKTSKSLLFIGTLSWEANLDGLLWFIEDVWPILTANQPDIRFYIVGKNPPQRLRQATWPHRQIVLTGFVEDTEPFYQSSRVLVVPLRFGSGIKVKVLNGMYRGLPCVTTNIGVEGLNVQSGSEMMIAETPENFARHVESLLEDEAQWTAMQSKARDLAKSAYTWNQLLKHHLGVIGELLDLNINQSNTNRPKKLA